MLSFRSPACAFPAALLAILLLGASPATASGGGGGGEGGVNPQCPWAMDKEVQLGSKTIHLPHDLFKATVMEHVVDNYAVTIDRSSQFITFTSPDGLVYQAGITRMENKRCKAFFIGKPVFIRRAAEGSSDPGESPAAPQRGGH